MTTFGDFEPDDAYDTAAADPEQVAIKLRRIRLQSGLELVSWESMDESEQAAEVQAIGLLLRWLRNQGAL